jgi:acyl-CoA thioesterase-1
MKPFQKIAALIFTFALSHAALAANNILVFGDSLSAGYGISRDASWVSLLQAELHKSHPQYEVINASISGETTAGGLRRIDKVLQQYQPKIIIIELGANDGLRGSAIADTEKNLAKIIIKSRAKNVQVLLLGIQLPPNYGASYAEEFRLLYLKLSKLHRVALLPFMLKGIAPDQFQADNLHPTAAAQQQILQNVLPKLTPLL